MGKDEVERAISAIESTIHTLDTWVLVCAALVAIGVLGESVLGILHWIKDRELAPLRIEQARIHEKELESLRNEASHLSVESDNARAQITLSNVKIADAERHTGEARAEAAQSLEKAADAQRKIAEANERTAKTELELAKIKAPRALNREQRVAIANALNPFPGQAYDLVVPKMMGRESMLPAQLISALQQAGWKLQSTQIEPRRKLEISEILSSEGVMSDSGIGKTQFNKTSNIEIGVDDGWVGITIGYEAGDATTTHSFQPHSSLVRALREAGMDTSMEEVSVDLKTLSVRKLGNEAVHLKEGPATVHIYIGRKN